MNAYPETSESENYLMKILQKDFWSDDVQKFSDLITKRSKEIIGRIGEAWMMLNFVKSGKVCGYAVLVLKSIAARGTR